MPKITYVGQTTKLVGKTLWEIVGNLNNYGVGRLITRGTHFRYPEPSFDKIVHVVPHGQDYGGKPSQNRRVTAWVERVFRGQKLPKLIELFSSSYKPDFQLIPKDEEEIWLKRFEECPPRIKILDPMMPLPPLLNLIFRQEKIARGEPVDDVVKVQRTKVNLKNRNFVKIAEEGETPIQYTRFGDPASPSLYANIEACRPFFENKETWDHWKSAADRKLAKKCSGREKENSS